MGEGAEHAFNLQDWAGTDFASAEMPHKSGRRLQLLRQVSVPGSTRLRLAVMKPLPGLMKANQR